MQQVSRRKTNIKMIINIYNTTRCVRCSAVMVNVNATASTRTRIFGSQLGCAITMKLCTTMPKRVRPYFVRNRAFSDDVVVASFGALGGVASEYIFYMKEMALQVVIFHMHFRMRKW